VKRGAETKPVADRRRRFAEEYCVDFNATQAAIRAGYSAHTARAQGSRLLTRVDIQARIEALMAGATRRAGITVERTQQEIARLAYGDRRKLYREDGSLKLPHELDDDAAALVQSLETEELFGDVVMENDKGKPTLRRQVVGLTRKVKTWDKGRALEQCMSMLGLHRTATPLVAEDNVLHLSIRLSNDKGR
jgi:phage terminase small subunit